MIKINKFVFKIILVVVLLGILNLVVPGSFSFIDAETTLETQNISTNNTQINEAIANLNLYSSYNYQTLTEAKLAQLSSDFYVPAKYGEVMISWNTDSDSIDISNEVEFITIQSISGEQSIEVYRVSIQNLPNAIQGNEPFVLEATLSLGIDIATTTISGELIPIMPDDFWGGVVFTFARYLSLFIEGVLTTLGLSLAGTIFGFMIALILVFMRLDHKNGSTGKTKAIIRKGMSSIAQVYITVFRGTPMIVQAAFFWYGLGLFGNAMICGLFVVSVNTAAYIAEILRGGIQSVDSGQLEAARSLGMSNFQAMRYVVFPQAIKNSMPSIGNEFVINIKDTSVLSVIGIFELFNQTKRIAGMHYRQLEAYFVVAIIYLFLTYTVTKGLQYVERKLDMPVKELTSSN